MRVGINDIDKDDFLTLYQEIRPAVFSSSTVQSGFRAAGIVSFYPDQVLSELNILLVHRLKPYVPGTLKRHITLPNYRFRLRLFNN